MASRELDYPALLTVRITQEQMDFLAKHKLETGNKPGEVIRLLLEYYIHVDTEGKK